MRQSRGEVLRGFPVSGLHVDFFYSLVSFCFKCKRNTPGGIMIGCQVSSSSLYNDAKRLREVGVVVAAARMIRYGQRD